MANEANMAPVSWRTLTSSRLTAIKDYVAKKDYKGTYESLSSSVRAATEEGASYTRDHWTRLRFGRTQGSSTNAQHTTPGVEKLQLFPGWAVRRLVNSSESQNQNSEFALEVYVSGFASSLRPPDKASRSQRAFYRLAKGYAALPKLSPISSLIPTNEPSRQASLHSSDTPPDINLPKFPPLSYAEDQDAELETFLAKFGELGATPSSTPDDERGTNEQYFSSDALRADRSDSYDGSDTSRSWPSASYIPAATTSTTNGSTTLHPEEVSDLVARKLHANLDTRLQPFWSSAIPNEMVRISIFCLNAGQTSEDVPEMLASQDTDFEPLITKDVLTDAQGSFQTTITVPWERMATHPPSLHVAFGDVIEYPVVIQAEMWPPPLPHRASSTPPSHSSHQAVSTPSSPTSQVIAVNGPSPIVARVTVPLASPRVPLRLISDIDDTIKYAGVLHGVKKVFQNVFTRHLEDLVIPDMTEWYRALWQNGVRFHYVSNSPYELLPVISEFFRISGLPQGSIRLKSYAARSFLLALLSPPAARKRTGVLEVLDAFLESRFILVGDTGEQDLELYTELARERPRQIVGVFLRDVTSTPGSPPVGGNMGYGAGGPSTSPGCMSQSGGKLISREPQAITQLPSVESLHHNLYNESTSESQNTNRHLNTSNRSSTTELPPSKSSSTLPGNLPRRQSYGMTSDERRRHELESRIERARAEIPSHIAFRVFRTPEECVEIRDILQKFPTT